MKTIFDLIEEHKDDKKLIVMPCTFSTINDAIHHLSDTMSIEKDILCVDGSPKPFLVFYEGKNNGKN